MQKHHLDIQAVLSCHVLPNLFGQTDSHGYMAQQSKQPPMHDAQTGTAVLLSNMQRINDDIVVYCFAQ